MNSFVMRPIRENDLEGLKNLAASIRGGMTSLPNDEELLESKIFESVRSFDPRIKKAGDQSYLFVLEDLKKKRLVGISGIHGRVGGFEPWYSYQIQNERFSHAPLNLEREVQVLHLKKEYKGPSEVCSLFLDDEYRKFGLGKLLSLSRFLFMGAFPKRFDTHVIAEMRGFQNEQGIAPFWESVGRHFFQKDFYTADFISGLGNKDFIQDLMPKYPIYITLLPPEVQAVIGRVHPDTEPALRLLKNEGFVESGEVDIFDSGPLIKAVVQEIRTIRESRTVKVRAFVQEIPDSPRMILSNRSLHFRSCLGSVHLNEEGTADLPEALEPLLEVKPGDSITYISESQKSKSPKNEEKSNLLVRSL
ncbi:MAG: arginine N-succinyltransferase [Verrucomicrobiota bacterium]